MYIRWVLPRLGAMVVTRRSTSPTSGPSSSESSSSEIKFFIEKNIVSRIWNFAWWNYVIHRKVCGETPIWLSLDSEFGWFWKEHRWFQLDVSISMLWSSSFQNHPNSLEIVITWCYRKPFHKNIVINFWISNCISVMNHMQASWLRCLKGTGHY